MGIRTCVVSVGETPVGNCEREALPSVASEDAEGLAGRLAHVRVLICPIRGYPLFDVALPAGARKGAR